MSNDQSSSSTTSLSCDGTGQKQNTEKARRGSAWGKDLGGRTYEAEIHLKLIRFNAPLDSKGKQLVNCSTVQLVNWSLGQLGNWPWLSRLSNNKINDKTKHPLWA